MFALLAVPAQADETVCQAYLRTWTPDYNNGVSVPTRNIQVNPRGVYSIDAQGKLVHPENEGQDLKSADQKSYWERPVASGTLRIFTDAQGRITTVQKFENREALWREIDLYHDPNTGTCVPQRRMLFGWKTGPVTLFNIANCPKGFEHKLGGGECAPLKPLAPVVQNPSDWGFNGDGAAK
jgi:hypothetical protein